MIQAGRYWFLLAPIFYRSGILITAMRSVWFVCVFASAGLGSFLPNSALAQVGDTLQLFQIEICAPIVAFEQVGDFVQFASLEYKEIQSSMGSYLQRNSNLSLRSYGPGSSIGLSIRGSSSAQSQVSLNGLNFDNPGLAQADLSLLPQGIFGSYKLLRGSGGAYLGNAAIGGCLMLDLPIDTVESLQLETGIGSFGQIDFSVKAAYRFGKTQHVTSLYRNASDNDFDRSK